MTVCDRIEARSMALAGLPPADAEYAEASAHATACARCAARLRDGARLLDLVTVELRPQPADFPGVEQAVLAAWDREQRPSWRQRLAVPIAAVALFAVLVAGAAHLVSDAGSWVLAAAGAAVAALVPSMAGKRALPAVLAASLALSLFAVSGAEAPNGHSGLICMGLEAACALVPIAIWCAAGIGALVEPASARATLAAAMALAAQAALHLSCPVRGVVVHLAFHLAGVLVAAALATQLQPRRSAEAP
ncbi:MAG TPA: hypothetical protein VLW85_20295 [Myxococcales bacterium]|nr:hypothetical protein [Myxococcales bacterium]